MADNPQLIDNWRRLRAQIKALPHTPDPDIAEWVRTADRQIEQMEADHHTRAKTAVAAPSVLID